MSDYLNTDSKKIKDPALPAIVLEIQKRLGTVIPASNWSRLSGLFEVAIKFKPKAFSTKIKIPDEVLLQIMFDPTQSGFVQDLSKELCAAFSKNPDDFIGENFLSLVLDCYSPQKPQKKKKVSARERRREFERTLEIQSRKNAKETDAMPLDRRTMKSKLLSFELSVDEKRAQIQSRQECKPMESQ
jgi:hypothetical protein